MSYSGEEMSEPYSSSNEEEFRPAAGKRRSSRINPSESKNVFDDLPIDGDEEGTDEEDDVGKVTPRPPPPPRSAEETESERQAIRSMWELASIFDFIHLFNEHILKLPVEFSADELESQLLVPIPGNMLKDIHIGMLKHVHPPCRPPADRYNWATLLTKKLCNAWPRLSEGECPLQLAQGEEQSVYEYLSPCDRVRVLKALCELRLDQEDIHNFVDFSLKGGVPLEAFRLEPVGTDSLGSVYWYPHPEGLEFGTRLYRESPDQLGKGKRGTGRRANPPPPGNWETVACTLSEFRNVAERMLESKKRADIRLGKYINETVVPNLEELEEKREKALRKAQRQAMQLQYSWSGGGLAAGRSRRERKAVNYTFDDFDRSINDAIKVTRRTRTAWMDDGYQDEGTEGMPEGHESDQNASGERGLEAMEGAERPDDAEASTSKLGGTRESREGANGHTTGGNGEGGGPRTADFEPVGKGSNVASLDAVQVTHKPHEAVHDAIDDSEDESYDEGEDEEIAGEVEYTDEFKEALKRKRKRLGLDDEEYEGEEEEEDDDIEEDAEDEDEGKYGNGKYESDDDDDEFSVGGRRQRRQSKRRGSSLREKKVQEVYEGNRRSSRSTRNQVDYRWLNGADEYEDDDLLTNDGATETSGATTRQRGARNRLEGVGSIEENEEAAEAGGENQSLKIKPVSSVLHDSRMKSIDVNRDQSKVDPDDANKGLLGQDLSVENGEVQSEGDQVFSEDDGDEYYNGGGGGGGRTG